MASEVIGDEIELAVEAFVGLSEREFLFWWRVSSDHLSWSFDPALLVKKSSLLGFSNEIS